MKNSIAVAAFIVVITLNACMTPQHASAQQGSVSFQLFYDELSPYGVWVDNPNYGYVWIPAGDPDFSPYSTNGYWVYTDDGWMWVSDYPWGWAAFHYGRWDYSTTVGWFWVPDNEWGPAWVSWRHSPGYYGWAPLRPGISISISLGGEYREQNDRWIFVRDGDVARRDVGRYYVDRTRNGIIIQNSTVIGNTRHDKKRNATYIAGPGRDDVQSATRSRIDPVVIRENIRPGQRMRNGELEIYRPHVQQRNDGGRNSAPSKSIKLNDVKPVRERNSGHQQQDVKTTGGTKEQKNPDHIAPAKPADRKRDVQQTKSGTEQKKKEKRKRD